MSTGSSTEALLRELTAHQQQPQCMVFDQVREYLLEFGTRPQLNWSLPATGRVERWQQLQRQAPKRRRVQERRTTAKKSTESTAKWACCICTENCDFSERVALAPCGHRCICSSCRSDMAMRGLLSQCPICRQHVESAMSMREVEEQYIDCGVFLRLFRRKKFYFLIKADPKCVKVLLHD